MKQDKNWLHAMLLQSRLQKQTPTWKNSGIMQIDPHLPLPPLHHFLLGTHPEQQLPELVLRPHYSQWFQMFVCGSLSTVK